MLKILIALLVGLCAVAVGLDVEQVADTIYLDGVSYEIVGYQTSQNGTVTLILCPIENVIEPSPEYDPAKDPRIGPGEHFLFKSQGALVTWSNGMDENGDPIEEES